MAENGCLVCKRIEMIKQGINEYFVTELETCYVVLGDFQFYKGYTLLLCKKHVKELHELKKNFRLKFLKEMSLVAEAVYNAFHPIKLNYELLGNKNSHPHWHIFPRYQYGPKPEEPVWCLDEKKRCTEKVRPSPQELKILKKKLLTEISKLL